VRITKKRRTCPRSIRHFPELNGKAPNPCKLGSKPTRSWRSSTGLEASGSSPEISLPIAIGANGQFIVPWPEEDIVLAINTDYTPPATDDRVYVLTNFPTTKPQGDQLFGDLYDIVEMLVELPE
jgi:hypothetical protein